VIIRIVIDVLQAFLVVLFLRIISSWFPINPWSKAARVVRVLERITDPILVPIRRLLPPVRMGGTGFDLSPLVVFFAIFILTSILRSR
jgi:YggT family protein